MVEYTTGVGEDEDEEMRAFLPMSFGKMQQPEDQSLDKHRESRHRVLAACPRRVACRSAGTAGPRWELRAWRTLRWLSARHW